MTTQPNTKCTCPSGDGSLRWPCPKHSPAAAQEAVVWQWRCPRADTDWSDCDKSLYDELRKAIGGEAGEMNGLRYEVRALYAAPVTAAPADAEEDAYVIGQTTKLLAEIAVIVNGPEPAGTRWSYHDLPAKVRALAGTPAAPADTWFADQLAAMGEVIPLDSTPAAPGIDLMRRIRLHLDRAASVNGDMQAGALLAELDGAPCATLEELQQRMADASPKGAAPAFQVPAGWSRVRTEPTAEMLDAGINEIDYDGNEVTDNVRNVWLAMIEAARKDSPKGDEPRTPIDGCTESNCPRCRTHPDHRGDMEHAGIGRRPPQDSPKGGSEAEVMQLRYQLNSLRQLLSGFDIAVQKNPLQPPCTYLEEVRLSHEFQPGCGHEVAAALRNALKLESEGAKQ